MNRFVWYVFLTLTFILGGTMTASNVQAPCASPEHRQFDFWLGDWNVFDYSGGTRGAPAGTNQITTELGGCVLQEHWTGSQGGHGMSFNTYQSNEKKWHQVWVDDGGTFLNLIGEFKGGAMVLSGEQPGAGITDRITWKRVNNDPDQVRQFWQQSRDGGKTWSAVFDGLYVRK